MLALGALQNRCLGLCSLRTLAQADGTGLCSQQYYKVSSAALCDVGTHVLGQYHVSQTEKTYLMYVSLLCPPAGQTLLKISLCSAMDLSCIDFSAFADLGSGSTPLKTFL